MGVHIDGTWGIPLNDPSIRPQPQWVDSTKNGRTDRDIVYRADWLKEQCISWVSTMAPPGEYD